MNRVLIIIFSELRLLLRSVPKLAIGIALPILGGVFFGLLCRVSASSVAVQGLFATLATGSILLAISPNASQMLYDTLRSDYAPSEGLLSASWGTTTVIFLTVQAFLYECTLSLLSPGSAPTLFWTIAGIISAVVLGIAAFRLIRIR